MVSDAGVVTIPAGLEARVTVKPPAGAGPDRLSVVDLVSVPVMLRVAGENASEAVVVTVTVLLPYPEAEAVMSAEPRPTPVTCGCVAG